MDNKVLVGITIQENSRRLISAGAELAKSLNAPLHILHIRKGITVFDNPESSLLLQELFSFGGELGGEVHFLCSDHVKQSIFDFIRENHITHFVIGETPVAFSEQRNTVGNTLLSHLSNIEVTVLPRQNEEQLNNA